MENTTKELNPAFIEALHETDFYKALKFAKSKLVRSLDSKKFWKGVYDYNISERAYDLATDISDDDKTREAVFEFFRGTDGWCDFIASSEPNTENHDPAQPLDMLKVYDFWNGNDTETLTRWFEDVTADYIGNRLENWFVWELGESPFIEDEEEEEEEEEENEEE